MAQPRTVCIDTDVLSCYLVENKRDANWLEKHKRAEFLFNSLEKTEKYISSIALMEVLFSFESPDEKQELLQLVLESFRVANFDLHCACIVANDLSNAVKIKDTKTPRKERGIIKEDLKILATALQLKADTLYTNNKRDFQKWAPDNLKVISLDDIEYQDSLFSRDE